MTFSLLVRQLRFAWVLVLALLAVGCVDADSPDGTDESIVVAHGGVGITTNATHNPNTPISISWSNMPGNPYDWIAIMPAGAPHEYSSIVRWGYTNGQGFGTIVLNGVPSGNYEARAYAGGTITPLASIPFTVVTVAGPTYTVTTNKTLYTAQEAVTVNWTGLPTSQYTWIAIVPQGAAPSYSGLVRWGYTNGQVNGSITFSQGVPTNGTYEARAYAAGTTTMLATTTFMVAALPVTITTNKSTYLPAESINVSWTGSSTNAYDWVAIVPAGSPPSYSGLLRWGYTNGQVSGSITFNGIAVGNYEARLYAGGTTTVRATTSFTVATAGTGICTPPPVLPQLGSVVSGDLVIATNQQYTTVPLTAPLASSILFTSVRENEPSPVYGSVMCRLHGAETITISGQPVDLPAGVTCTRNTPGTDTGLGVINVRYSVVSFSSGVTVQRGVANTGLVNPTIATLTPVNPSESFVLLGGSVNNGTGWGNNEFVRAVLSPTSVEVRTDGPGTRVSWQVVSMTGASVQRGTTTFAPADLTRTVTIATAPSGSLALASYTTNNASGIAAGAMMLESRLSGLTTLELSRQLGGSTLDISWEVVSLPFATFSGNISMASGVSMGSATISGANFTSASSVALCSSQALFGTSTGSSSYAGSAIDLVGEAAATLTTGTNTVTLQRATSQAAARFPWTVIDFGHGCNGL